MSLEMLLQNELAYKGTPGRPSGPSIRTASCPLQEPPDTPTHLDE